MKKIQSLFMFALFIGSIMMVPLVSATNNDLDPNTIDPDSIIQLLELRVGESDLLTLPDGIIEANQRIEIEVENVNTFYLPSGTEEQYSVDLELRLVSDEGIIESTHTNLNLGETAKGDIWVSFVELISDDSGPIGADILISYPQTSTPIIGGCATVTPGYNDECCKNNGYAGWNADEGKCYVNSLPVPTPEPYDVPSGYSELTSFSVANGETFKYDLGDSVLTLEVLSLKEAEAKISFGQISDKSNSHAIDNLPVGKFQLKSGRYVPVYEGQYIGPDGIMVGKFIIYEQSNYEEPVPTEPSESGIYEIEVGEHIQVIENNEVLELTLSDTESDYAMFSAKNYYTVKDSMGTQTFNLGLTDEIGTTYTVGNFVISLVDLKDGEVVVKIRYVDNSKPVPVPTPEPVDTGIYKMIEGEHIKVVEDGKLLVLSMSEVNSDSVFISYSLSNANARTADEKNTIEGRLKLGLDEDVNNREEIKNFVVYLYSIEDGYATIKIRYIGYGSPTSEPEPIVVDDLNSQVYYLEEGSSVKVKGVSSTMSLTVESLGIGNSDGTPSQVEGLYYAEVEAEVYDLAGNLIVKKETELNMRENVEMGEFRIAFGGFESRDQGSFKITWPIDSNPNFSEKLILYEGQAKHFTSGDYTLVLEVDNINYLGNDVRGSYDVEIKYKTFKGKNNVPVNEKTLNYLGTPTAFTTGPFVVSVAGIESGENDKPYVIFEVKSEGGESLPIELIPSETLSTHEEQEVVNNEEIEIVTSTPAVEGICNSGCLLNDNCVDYGIRTANGQAVFCDLTGEFSVQKEDGQTCQNNFECESNSCSSGICVDLNAKLDENANMLRKIMSWFGRWF